MQGEAGCLRGSLRKWFGLGIHPVSGIHQGLESSDLAPAYAGAVGWGKGSTKKQWCLPMFLFPERAALTPAPPVLKVKVVSSVLPHMSLALFELLPQCCSLEQVSL